MSLTRLVGKKDCHKTETMFEMYFSNMFFFLKTVYVWPISHLLAWRGQDFFSSFSKELFKVSSEKVGGFFLEGSMKLKIELSFTLRY